MPLPEDYQDGDVLSAADVNAITAAVNGSVPTSIIADKGDLLVGLTNDSVGALSVGTNGYVLTASSGASTGLAWTAVGGKLLNFDYDTDTTDRSTTSTSATDIPGVTITYTPLSATSNLVVDLWLSANVLATGSTAERNAIIRLTDGTDKADAHIGRNLASASASPLESFAGVHIRRVYPSTGTTARTFKAQFFVPTTNLTVTADNSQRGPAVITVMEVAS